LQVQEEIQSKFGFIEREEGKLKVEVCAKKNLLGYKLSLKERTVKQNVGLVIVSGGSGSGKTTATREMLKVLKDLSAKVFFYIN
jgi:type II secretory ATPase GspE/PulE/Tfp pilus assembly ATPase PilB-like protein